MNRRQFIQRATTALGLAAAPSLVVGVDPGKDSALDTSFVEQYAQEVKRAYAQVQSSLQVQRRYRLDWAMWETIVSGKSRDGREYYYAERHCEEEPHEMFWEDAARVMREAGVDLDESEG